ncbi:MAG: alpha-amylase family protein [Chloroflexota bacterium]
MTPTQTQKIGTRQIHLDFHTSEYLPDIGKNFSKAQFQAALKAAHVDAINIFAKGHHSWSYYPTKVGQMHPNLEFDLLGAQIEACHEIGVLAPIYYTVGWSSNDADNNPDWVMRDPQGDPVTAGTFDWSAKPNDPRPRFHWIFLCPNTGYHDHMMAQVEELCKNYPVDGFWFDIYQVHRLCYCDTCKAGMTAQGIDVSDEAAVQAYRAQVVHQHQRAMHDLISQHHPNATVFFNGTTSIERNINFVYEMFGNNTMQDLEDLPTTWGGYDKLPLQSKYFLKAGYPITAMSGKFHTAWGEFGGFKHPNALKYEAASMTAWGANCNFGDQLHPVGEMDMATYENIGQAYAYVEQIEDFGIGGLPIARVGFWRSFDQPHDEGLARILLESHVNFDIANLVDDLTQFDVIVIPGKPCLTPDDAARMNGFVQQGGRIVVMAAGALNQDGDQVLLDIGASYAGEANYDIDYLVVDEAIGDGLVQSPFLNYAPALRVQPEADTEILATIREPYFSRTYQKFTSHQNTPYQLDAASHPGLIRKGNVIFIAHALDKMYYELGARLHRDLFVNALRLVHTRPMVETALPSAGRISLLHQPQHNRYVAHLLYGPPIQRGRCEVIEDLPTLTNVPVMFDLPVSVERVLLVPDMEELPIHQNEGKHVVTIPQFSCHCAVVFEYA